MTLAGDARTVMLEVKGAFDMRPPEGLVFIPLGPPRTSEQILVRRRNAALSSAAEAYWAHAARSTGRDDSAERIHPIRKAPGFTWNSGLCSSISRP